MRPFLAVGLGWMLLIGNQASAAESKLKSVPDMIQALKNKDEKDLRILAAKRLRQLGTAAKEAVPDLIDALRDNNQDVRMQGRKALAAIGPAAVPAMGH